MRNVGLLCGLLVLCAAVGAVAEGVTVSEGREVAIHYTLTVNGEVIDSSVGGEPLTYIQGKGMIIPGLEKALEGMAVGEKKSVVVSAEEGYGQPDSRAVVEVPRQSLPPDLTVQVGMPVEVPTPQGPLPGLIEKVGETTVVINFNHPLTGQELHFEVEVVSVK